MTLERRAWSSVDAPPLRPNVIPRRFCRSALRSVGQWQQRRSRQKDQGRQHNAHRQDVTRTRAIRVRNANSPADTGAFAVMILAAAAFGGAAQAAPMPVATPDMTLIPLVSSDAGYVLNGPSSCGDFSGSEFCITGALHLMFPPPLSISFIGGNEVETVNSEIIAQVTVNGGPDITATLSGPTTVTAFGRTSDSEAGTFAVQMEWDLTGSIGSIAAEFASRADAPTTGSDTFAEISGQDYTTSYFDVYPQVSVDGGPFTPVLGAAGQPQAQLEALPEPASPAILGVGLAALTLVRVRRRA